MELQRVKILSSKYKSIIEEEKHDCPIIIGTNSAIATFVLIITYADYYF